MSEQIREQISAFLDGELPGAETELLLKRLMRDAEFRGCFGRYALIGEACRGSASARLTRGFAERVNRAIDVEAPAAAADEARTPRVRWWRHAASGAVAAGVAVVAVFALQHRANEPVTAGVAAYQRPTFANNLAPATRSAMPVSAIPVSATSGAVNGSHEALSYTVPSTLGEAPAALPPARLTDYVFAHSEYTSFLGQRNLLSGLIAEPDGQFSSAGEPALAPAPAPAPPAAAAQVPSDSRSGP